MSSISSHSTHPDDPGYVYLLIDPRDNVPFYVGQTTQADNRIQAHIGDGRKHRIVGDGSKASIIKSILMDGYEPVMRIIEITTRKYVSDREFWWYETFINRGYKITGEVLKRAPVVPKDDETLNIDWKRKLEMLENKEDRQAVMSVLLAFSRDMPDYEGLEELCKLYVLTGVLH